ncbi:MAG TPA: D-inositol-3-phosphate glycosyltransferase, partial [Nocardioides sp.]|nr:D-inositol-3-phosphate glycosyltransferase [Nocardioides sp.]
EGHDPGTWARALRRLVEEDEYAARLGAGALRHAALFSWERTAAATLEVYEQARERMTAELVR